MSIPIIDKLQPLGNFPAVDAGDVDVNGARLDAVLAESATILNSKASKSYVDEQIAGIPQSDVTKTYVDDNFAKKSEIPIVPTKTSQLQNDSGFTKFSGNYNDLSNRPSKVSAFQNDAGYLTQHQSLSEYAKKSEIPTVPTNVSSFVNDAGYLTEHQDITGKADILTVEELSATVDNVSENQTALSARMDTFTNLPEGSTTGDAELADGRIAADGTVYDNLGGAIRGQVTELKFDVKYTNENVLASGYMIPKSRVESGAWENKTKAASNKRLRVNELVDVKKGNVFVFNEPSLYYYIFVYDQNGELAETVDWNKNPRHTFTNDGQIAICFANGNTYGSSTTIAVDDYSGKSFVDRGNSNVENYAFAISGGVVPEISGTNTAKIKIDASQITVLGSADYGVAFSADTIVSQIGSSASRTATGFEITLTNRGCFYFDKIAKRFGVSANAIYPVNAIVLVANWYGNYSGEWISKLVNDRIGKTSTVADTAKAVAYPTGGGVSTEFIPTFSSGSVIVKIKSSEKRINIVRSGNNYNFVTFASMVNDVSAELVDDTVKVTVPAYSAFVYNKVEGKSKIIQGSMITDGDFVLALNTYSTIASGLLCDDLTLKRITALEGDIADISALPDYVVAEINDTKHKLIDLNPNNFNYLLVTDIHYSHSDFSKEDLTNLFRSIKSIASGSNIDAVVMLGDFIEGGSARDKFDSVAQMEAIVEYLADVRKPVLVAMGNHDNNAFNWSTWTTDIKNTNHYITTNNFINIAERPFGYAGTYYAVDFDDKQKRVIVANTCEYNETVDAYGNVNITDYAELMISQEQLDKIEDMVRESDYDCIILAHGISMSLVNVIKYINEHSEEYNGNKVVLYHTGHYHNDTIEKITAYSLNLISTDCTSMSSVQRSASNLGVGPIGTGWLNQKGGTVKNPAREKRTISDYLYDVISVGSDKITRIRFGAGSDGHINL